LQQKENCNEKACVRFSDKLKTGVPQTGQLYIQKIAQRIEKRPTDKAHRPAVAG